jgi:hypothetical protein
MRIVLDRLVQSAVGVRLRRRGLERCCGVVLRGCGESRGQTRTQTRKKSIRESSRNGVVVV